MGQSDGEIYLVETVEDVASLRVKDENNLAYVTQTTLSVDDTARIIFALRRRFPEVRGPRRDDICYATQNRQDSVKALAQNCDVVFVVGSPNSSNSSRLREVAEAQGARAYMIDGAQDIQRDWLEGARKVGVTAGASAPEVLVQGVVECLRGWGAELVGECEGPRENISFPVPAALR
jgi:4-hydroxy-3-methylbut-2-enyl diphosphate reductase